MAALTYAKKYGLGKVDAQQRGIVISRFLVTWEANPSVWPTDSKQALAVLESATGGGDKLLTSGAAKEIGWLSAQEGFAIFEADSKDSVLGMVQQLSCMSSGWGDLLGKPGFCVSHHGVEDDQDLPHAGYQRDLLELAGGQQALVESADDRVMPTRDQCSHVEDGSDRGPAAPDHASTLELAAVPRQRSGTQQLRDLAAVQAAKLWQAADKSCSGGRTNDTGAAQDAVLSLPIRIGLDRLAQLGLNHDQPPF
jgi:hypothetical protein